MWEEREVAEQILVSTYAGYAAQAHHDPAQEARARWDARVDFQDADKILGYAYKDDALRRQQELLLGRARDFVAEPRHWAAIKAVAEELVIHETLAGEEVESIIDGADGDPEAA